MAGRGPKQKPLNRRQLATMRPREFVSERRQCVWADTNESEAMERKSCRISGSIAEPILHVHLQLQLQPEVRT